AASASSSAPLFGLFSYDVGGGIVAGQFVDVSRQGKETGRLIARVMNGEHGESIAPIHVVDNPVEVDWRALQRWRIDPRKLPSDAVISYREPTIWSAYGWYIFGGSAVLLIQTLLILVLVAQRSRRKRDRNALGERLRFERLISNLSARFV